MARNRMIKPDFWRDNKTTDLGFLERLMFIGLWTFADDNGVGRADIELLMSDIFPRGKKPTLKQFSDSLFNIAKSGMVVLYEIDGERYYHVKNFNKHQNINRPTPSNLPLPDGQEIQFSELSVSSNEQFNDNSRLKEEKRKEEEIEVEVEVKEEKKGKEVPQESEKTLRGEYKNIPLSEEQYQRLVDKYGQFAVDKKIGSMSSAKEATPKKYIYKNYEAALRNWIESDSTLTKQSDKPSKNSNGNFNSLNEMPD